MKASVPQLRVRTEFSFKEAFGPIARVTDVLEGLGTSVAAIVDDGTWGHGRWARAMKGRNVRPAFGAEVIVPTEDGRKPRAWALALDMKAFYRFSTAARARGADPEGVFRDTSPEGVARICGDALSDPETFDYIDLSPNSPIARRRALRLAERTKKPLILTSDNYYPAPDDIIAFEALGGSVRVTPQHILGTTEELQAAMPDVPAAVFRRALKNTRALAERLASELPKAPIIKVEGDLRAMAYAGRDRRRAAGHLPGWDETYDARLERELSIVEEKAFESYFIVVADLVTWAKQHMLVGPGRGSSAGSLLCYCIGITEVDPIPHGLLFERFIDLNRTDLPDIDIDFSDAKRDMVFDYLAEKYGRDCVARLGNINTYKPRSVMAQVCKRLGIPDHERYNVLNVLIEYSSGDSRFGKGLEDTFENTVPGEIFIRKYPEAEVMTKVENHASHTGVHAAGVVVSNERLDNFCTVGPDGIAHVDKPDTEPINFLKIDALGLRTLGIIEDTGVVTSDQLYSLTLDDPKVFSIFNAFRFNGIFQFEGQAQRSISAQIHVSEFKHIDHITALSRPGPLGGGATVKYIQRHAGKAPPESAHPMTARVLGDTYGLVLYQEQVMRIVREIGGFSWEETSTIRKAMSGRKGREYFGRMQDQFVAGAAKHGIEERVAVSIWLELLNFGAWGMNKSHTCAYAVISYWCAWMKAYHVLEYTASCLRHAKDDEQTLAILREAKAEGINYTPFDPDRSDVNWSVRDGVLLGGWMNLVGVGKVKAGKFIRKRDTTGLTDEDREKIAGMTLKFQELYPIRAAYGDLYDNPEKHGCREGSIVYDGASLPDVGNVLYIGRIQVKKQRDINEFAYIQKRAGVVKDGPAIFADLTCIDDTGVPIIVRISRFKFNPFGRRALTELSVGDDILVRGRKLAEYPMIQADKIRCLNNPEAMR